MLNLNLNLKSIQEKIYYKDRFKENKYDIIYGFHQSSHVTLLYGLTDEISSKEIFQILSKYKFNDIVLQDISFFNLEDKDILKFKVSSSDVLLCNKELRSKFNYYSDFEKFEPHVTIAYLKKNTAKNYCKLKFDKEIINATNYLYTDIFDRVFSEKTTSGKDLDYINSFHPF